MNSQLVRHLRILLFRPFELVLGTGLNRVFDQSKMLLYKLFH